MASAGAVSPSGVRGRLSPLRVAAVLALGFALTLVSNTMEPGVMGHKVLQLVPDARNTALGFTSFAGLAVAVLVQPVVGALSDRTRSRWGRRLPYLATGVVLLIGTLYLIAAAPLFGLVVVGVLATQLASNLVQAPSQALLPDQVEESRRGRVAGLKATLDIVAFVVGRLVAGLLLGLTPRLGETAVLLAVSVPAVVLVVALTVTALGAREGPGAADAAPARPLREVVAGAFRVDFRAHPAFAWWFANRLLFWVGFIALNTFLLFFVLDVLHQPEAAAQRLIGQLSTVLGVVLAAVALPAGWLADRVGRKPTVMAGGCLAAAGTAVLLTARDVPGLVLAGVLVGLGVGVFLGANWALITDIVPPAEAARYLGVANIATAGGSGLARLLGGTLIDPINAAFGSRSAGYLAVYGIAGLCFLASALVIVPLPGARRQR